MKKFKKLCGSFFWLLLNFLALAGCIRFFLEDLSREVPHNVWVSLILFVVGVIIIDFSIKKLIENLFEKIKKPNRFLKRMFIFFTVTMINMIAATMIVFAIASAFNLSADFFFIKILVGILMILDIWKLKKVLERIRKNRPVKHLLPYG